MPCCKTHGATGTAIGAAGGLITYLNEWSKQNAIAPGTPVNVAQLVTCTVSGSIIGKMTAGLPDLLEPATSSHHRGFCHSATAAAAIGYGMHQVIKSNLHPLVKAALLIAGTSYNLHLLEDAGTPRGIPIAFRNTQLKICL